MHYLIEAWGLLALNPVNSALNLQVYEKGYEILIYEIKGLKNIKWNL